MQDVRKIYGQISSVCSPFMLRSKIGIDVLHRSWYSDWLRAGRSGDRNPVGVRFSAPVQTGPGAHPASCTMGTGSFPGVKSGRVVTLTPYTLLVPWSRKSRAIPLLPLWVVRPVQSLSACTRVHFNFTYTSTPPMGRTACTEPQCLYKGALYLYLYLSSHYGPYGLYRASVPVQRCTLPSPIPLLPLWAVRPVQSLNVCTTVHFTFTYTSTPTMDRTTCTEPKWLCKGARYLLPLRYIHHKTIAETKEPPKHTHTMSRSKPLS